MRVSPLEDHCLRCLARIARAEGRVTIPRIAEAEGLSVENTAKVLAKLREVGLIESFRGKDGGYVLARPAAQISISDVLQAIGGELFEYERCSGADAGEPCVHAGDCTIRPIWLLLGELMHGFLNAITLADLVDDEPAVQAKLRSVRDALRLPEAMRRASAARAEPLLLGALPARRADEGAH